MEKKKNIETSRIEILYVLFVFVITGIVIVCCSLTHVYTSNESKMLILFNLYIFCGLFAMVFIRMLYFTIIKKYNDIMPINDNRVYA